MDETIITLFSLETLVILGLILYEFYKFTK